MSYDERAAVAERRLSEPARPTREAGRYLDRELPGDLFSEMMRGGLSVREATQIARDRWADDEARGISMNDMVRHQLEALGSPGGRADKFEKARDARGRFQQRERVEGRTGDLSMNERIRQEYFGASIYGARK